MAGVNSILGEASKNAEGAQATLRVMANVLRETLVEIHGGSWSILIDHQAFLLAISKDFPPEEEHIQPSQLREVV